VTLKDAADYIMALPKNVHDAPHWQLAMEQLIDAAEGRNFIMHAHCRAEGAESRQAESRFRAPPQGRQETQDHSMTVLIYVNTSKQVGAELFA
jgi:hypothetical protein